MVWLWCGLFQVALIPIRLPENEVGLIIYRISHIVIQGKIVPQIGSLRC